MKWHRNGNGWLADENDHEVLSLSGASVRVASLACAAPELLDALREVLPLAEAYLRKAPGDPDNAKLEFARSVILKATER